MNDDDDPILQILRGENINYDSDDSDNIKIDESQNELTQENDLNKNIDSSKEESNINDNNKILENKSETKVEKLDEKSKKKLEGEKVKKIDEFFPKNLSPLDFVNYIEVERTSGTIMNEMQNFILENHMKKDNKYEVLESKTLSQINSEISDIDIKLFYTKKDLVPFFTKAKFPEKIKSKKHEKFSHKLFGYY